MTQGNTQGSEPQAQSSSMVALRTIVMIVFLVVVPLIAVFGTGLPGSLRTAMQGRAAGVSNRPAPQTSEPVTAPSELAAAPLANENAADREPPPNGAENSAYAAQSAEAGAHSPEFRTAEVEPLPDRPPQVSITAVRTGSPAPRARITQVRALPEVSAAPLATAPFWAPAPRTASTPRGRNLTAHFESSDSSRRVPAQKAAKKTAGESPLQATAYSAPATPPRSETTSSQPTDAFARGERRLRELGASHYRLETWGERGELFRCTANVKLPSGRRAMRHFEATAPSPSQAIEQLLAKVEAWREAGS